MGKRDNSVWSIFSETRVILEKSTRPREHELRSARNTRGMPLTMTSFRPINKLPTRSGPA